MPPVRVPSEERELKLWGLELVTLLMVETVCLELLLEKESMLCRSAWIVEKVSLRGPSVVGSRR